MHNFKEIVQTYIDLNIWTEIKWEDYKEISLCCLSVNNYLELLVETLNPRMSTIGTVYIEWRKIKEGNIISNMVSLQEALDLMPIGAREVVLFNLDMFSFDHKKIDEFKI